MKRCPICGLDLPLSEFWRNRSAKDGLQQYCKGCIKARRAAMPECSLGGCANPSLTKKSGLCQPHFYLQRDGKPLDTPLRPKRPGQPVKTSGGYYIVWINGRYIMEHRHVMEQHLGRTLFATEVVHHRNGSRTDNRLSNLELWDTSHPKGQRVEDKIEWTREFLARYG